MKHLKMKRGGKTPFGMLSVKAGIDNNPNPTQADRIAGATDKAAYGMKVKEMGHGGKMDYMGHGGKMDYMGHGGKMKYMGGGKMPEYAHGGKSVSNEAPGSVDALLELLANYDQDSSIGECLDILNEMYGMSPQTSAMSASSAAESMAKPALQGPMTMFGARTGQGAGSVMRNLPPETMEELIRQFGSQGQE